MNSEPHASANFDAFPQRQRTRVACQPCRQRKRKCDSLLPCCTCARYNYECSYTQTNKAASTSTASRLSRQSASSMSQPVLIEAALGSKKRWEAPFVASSTPSTTAMNITAKQSSTVLDPAKQRFVRAGSAIAFPRILGIDQQFDRIAPLHSFGWHLGLREEPEPGAVNITSLLSWNEMKSLAGVFFKIVNTELSFLDETDFEKAASDRFNNSMASSEIDAILLGVAALGSYFSSLSHPKEAEFVSTARNLLMDYGLTLGPTLTSVSGWILRTLMLRLTSRPHAAWLASATTMHLAAGCGLHKEIQTITIVHPQPANDEKLVNQRRRLFWVGRALNIICSFEYGRNRVEFDGITTRRTPEQTNANLILLAAAVPSDMTELSQSPDSTVRLVDALTQIEQIQPQTHLQKLIKADIVFGLYRRIWLINRTHAKEQFDSIIRVGLIALEAADVLLQTSTPWWNISHTPFQFLCVILSNDTTRNLSYGHQILEHLNKTTTLYDTSTVREMYNQAISLVKSSCTKRRQELDLLSGYPGIDASRETSTSGMQYSDQMVHDWASSLPFSWDDILNPSLMIAGMSTPNIDGYNLTSEALDYPGDAMND